MDGDCRVVRSGQLYQVFLIVTQRGSCGENAGRAPRRSATLCVVSEVEDAKAPARVLRVAASDACSMSANVWIGLSRDPAVGPSFDTAASPVTPGVCLPGSTGVTVRPSHAGTSPAR